MYISGYFTNNGTPVTGLTPLIDIYKVDGTHVVNAQAMAEIGGGFYTYNFSSYDNSIDYVWVLDGTATITNANERYLSGSNDSRSIWQSMKNGINFLKIRR